MAAGDIVGEYDHGNQAIFRVIRYSADYAGLPFSNRLPNMKQRNGRSVGQPGYCAFNNLRHHSKEAAAVWQSRFQQIVSNLFSSITMTHTQANILPYPAYRRKLNTAIFLTTISGAVSSLLYLSVFDPLPTDGQAASRPLDFYTVAIFVAFMAFSFWLGDRISHDRHMPIAEWYERLRQAETAVTPPQELRRYIYIWPLRQTLGTAAMWVLAGTFFSALALWGDSLYQAVRNFIAITGVGGIISSTLLYFVVDWMWRPVIALFAGGEDPRKANAFQFSVLGRLLTGYLLIGIVPPALLVLITSQRLPLLLTAVNPQVLANNLLLIQLFILITGLIAGIGIVIFMTRGIVAPLDALQQGMMRVERNDFDVVVPVTSSDEIGYLTARFNQMAGGLRQGELLRNLLNLYVSPEVARNALENGAELGGQLITCSVLFADIRDFTTISEQMAPETLMKLLNRYMSEMVNVIVQHGGMVNKFGGDSLLVVFGTPLNPQAAHAVQAVQAAQGMFAALAAFNARQPAEQPQLRIGVGIATGPVVAGNVGGEERLEYTVIGDTVNLASRLQDKTKEVAADLLISEVTYTAVQPHLDTNAERLTAVTVKGKQQVLSVYAVPLQPSVIGRFHPNQPPTHNYQP